MLLKTDGITADFPYIRRVNLLPWSLAYSRLRRFALHSLSIAVVVALAILSLLTIQGISYSSVRELVNYSLGQIPNGDRTITVTSNRLITTSAELSSISVNLAKDFSPLVTSELSREILYHELADDHGAGFYFGGADELEKFLLLKSGRLPRMCSPALCEVIEIGGEKENSPQIEMYGMVVVGKATLAGEKVFTGTFAPDDSVPLFLADGVIAATSLKSLESLQGANGWVSEINRQAIEDMGLEKFINSVVHTENQIAINESGLALTWPQDSLSEAKTTGNALRARFNLLVYSIGAFLMILLSLLSVRRRSEHLQFRSGLSRIGTPRKILVQTLIIEYAAPILLGIFAGLILSPLIPAILNKFNFEVLFSHIFSEHWQINFGQNTYGIPCAFFRKNTNW
jgi:hypothetical protein